MHLWTCLLLVAGLWSTRLIDAEPDVALCADPTCSVAIGAGRTTVRASAVGQDKLAFKADESVVIFSKDDNAGQDGLWGVEVSDR
jgi:hypothetical protein